MAPAVEARTIYEAAPLIAGRAITSVSLVEACLVHIDRLQPVLNAFITVMADAALDQARAADAEIASEIGRAHV